jgi:hypothetical protein
MNLAVLYSRALSGMEAALVTVEVHIANGLPNFTLLCTIKSLSLFESSCLAIPY